MVRPERFEGFRWLGDKRTQRVYDLEHADEADVASAIESIMAAESFAVFGPDTLAEARNRGYRPGRATSARTGTDGD